MLSVPVRSCKPRAGTRGPGSALFRHNARRSALPLFVSSTEESAWFFPKKGRRSLCSSPTSHSTHTSTMGCLPPCRQRHTPTRESSPKKIRNLSCRVKSKLSECKEERGPVCTSQELLNFWANSFDSVKSIRLDQDHADHSPAAANSDDESNAELLEVWRESEECTRPIELDTVRALRPQTKTTRSKRLERTRTSGGLLTSILNVALPTRSYFGHLSGVLYESQSHAVRQRLRLLLRTELKPLGQACGNYWRLQEMRASFSKYHAILEAALRTVSHRVLEAGKKCGVFVQDHETVAHSLGHLLLTQDQFSMLRGGSSSKPIEAAIKSGRLDELRALCIAGADLSIETMRAAAKSHSPEAARILLEFADEVPLCILFDATVANASSTFEVFAGYLSEHGELAAAASTKRAGFTVLHTAAVENNVSILQAAAIFPELRSIVDMRTKRDATKKSLRQVLKQTALHKACRYGRYEAAKILLRDLCASPDVFDVNGRQALHIAASFGYVRVVELLLRYGAKSKVVDRKLGRRTPLDYCALGAASSEHLSSLRSSAQRECDQPERIDFAATASVLECPPPADRCPPDGPRDKPSFNPNPVAPSLWCDLGHRKPRLLGAGYVCAE